MPGIKRWVFVANANPNRHNTLETDVDIHGHGTCVLSKVAGPTFGVAKNANVVIVKIPWNYVDDPSSYYLDALSGVAEDVVKYQVKNAILNLSFGT